MVVLGQRIDIWNTTQVMRKVPHHVFSFRGTRLQKLLQLSNRDSVKGVKNWHKSFSRVLNISCPRNIDY